MIARSNVEVALMRCKLLLVTPMVTAGLLLGSSGGAFAQQAPGPTVPSGNPVVALPTGMRIPSPDPTGLPMWGTIMQVVSWIMAAALVASGLAIVVGGAFGWLASHFGNHRGATFGKEVVVGGLVGAVATGAGFGIAFALYAAAHA